MEGRVHAETDRIVVEVDFDPRVQSWQSAADEAILAYGLHQHHGPVVIVLRQTEVRDA